MSKLTKQHFQSVADAIASTSMPDDVRRQLVAQLMLELAHYNDAFDGGSFARACEPSKYTPLWR